MAIDDDCDDDDDSDDGDGGDDSGDDDDGDGDDVWVKRNRGKVGKQWVQPG